MGRTSYSSWNCDNCGGPFEPNRNQRARDSGLVTCRSMECRSAITSRVRSDTEREKFDAAHAGPVPMRHEITSIMCHPKFYQTKTTDPMLQGVKRFLVVSDIHAPFQDDAALDLALSEEADICVVNGDITDSYSFSKWTKFEQVSWAEEWKAVERITDEICKRYPVVRMVTGNHDERLHRKLAEHIPPDHWAWIKEKVGSLDPIAVLADKHKNLTLSLRSVDGHEVAWFDQIGDVIFSHAEDYSSAETNLIPRKLDTYFRNFSSVLGLDPFSLIIQAHTHDLSWNPIGGNVLVMQSGCLCKTQGYQLRPRKLPNRPQQLGYITFTMVDGKVDIPSVHPHWIRR